MKKKAVPSGRLFLCAPPAPQRRRSRRGLERHGVPRHDPARTRLTVLEQMIYARRDETPGRRGAARGFARRCGSAPSTSRYRTPQKPQLY